MTPNEIIESAKRVIETEIQGLRCMQSTMGDAFVQAVEMICPIKENKGRVIISGMGKSGHIGQKIAATLASTGTPSFFVHPSEASHGDLGMVTQEDLLITISNSGESREMGDIISYSRRYNIPMIAITSRIESTMAKAADLVLLIPNAKEAPEACPLGLAPTTSTTLTLAMGDALAVALIEKRGFTMQDFKDRHPGGKLGNVLLKVEDIMATGSELPLIGTDILMADALVVMTAKSLGCLGVVDTDGHLLGVITDGDLRRHMAADLIVRKTQDIMTKNPKTLIKDMLGVEAIAYMNEHKITNIFVVDGDNKPIGLLHVHHLLKAGVA
ncbi:MAG: KpsF/GutQ family sugar-phosphate isomerase [Alphaproteobacteria bacterium]|nr:KpsF/GutQ family sugar-phosphate isomerase [Alphaproteobacteria bacterium]